MNPVSSGDIPSQEGPTVGFFHPRCIGIAYGITFPFQAFINTAKEIYQKIQDGVFDINNEVRKYLVYELASHGYVQAMKTSSPIYADHMHCG
jgi:hypothetical protein